MNIKLEKIQGKVNMDHEFIIIKKILLEKEASFRSLHHVFATRNNPGSNFSFIISLGIFLDCFSHNFPHLVGFSCDVMMLFSFNKKL